MDTFEEEEVSLDELSNGIKDTQQELHLVEIGLVNELKSLHEMNEKDEEELENFIQRFLRV